MTIAKKQKIERRVWNGIYTVEQVLSKIKPVNAVDVMVDFNGNLIKMSSQRYLLFSRSCTCCVCGVIGIFFAKERHSGSTRWHFNLYAIDDDGDEVLMTKDHIIPRSRGGENTLNVHCV